MVILFLPGCPNPNGIRVLSPRSGFPTAVDVEDLARFIRAREGDEVPLLTWPHQITEVIVVCLDCSGSMFTELDGTLFSSEPIAFQEIHCGSTLHNNI
jgi:hypothetical protein